MVDQNNSSDQFSVIPKGVEEREYFIEQLNKLVDLKFQLDALKDTQKSIMITLFDKSNLDIKKSKYNKRMNNLIKEHLNAKLTEESIEAESTVDDYSLISNKLR